MSKERGRRSSGTHRAERSGHSHRARPDRRGPIALAVAAVVAMALLSLGATGTLASWTTAAINNTSNTVATAPAAILQEVSGAATCTSSDVVSNSSTCATINKYGGTTVPLSPGSSQSVDVTFKNVGAAIGASFTLTPGTCSSTPSTGTPTPANLCATGDLRVAISCSPGATYNAGSAWTDLAYAAGAPPTTTLTHTAANDLRPNDQWTCRFTASLVATANLTAQGITVAQPLTWTLNS